MITILTECYTI